MTAPAKSWVRLTNVEGLECYVDGAGVNIVDDEGPFRRVQCAGGQGSAKVTESAEKICQMVDSALKPGPAVDEAPPAASSSSSSTSSPA